ncbi:MAG: MerR family transcriptional regulator [Acidobacteriota bacterium]
MFKIGDFSKIAQTPVSQLRYYADIGLFVPEEVDPSSGYRYYSARQLPRLNKILVLKHLGLSLNQIRSALSDEISAEEVRGMLRLQKARLEQSVQEEILRLRAVEARLRQIEEERPDPAAEVVLKSVPAQKFLAMRETFPLMTDTLGVVQEMLQVLPDRFGPRLGYMTAILHNPSFNFEDVDLELGFAIGAESGESITLPSDRVLEVRDLPAFETMATVARVGPFENNCRSYALLGGWLESNGYTFAGPAREVFLQPPCAGPEEDIVVEIQAPVNAGPGRQLTA